MSLVPHTSLTQLMLETALIVVIADSLVAVAALAAAACLKRNPAAAHCVLALALAWMLVTPLGALARTLSGVPIVSLPGPAEVLVSALEPKPAPAAVGVEDTSNAAATPELAPALPRYKPSYKPTSNRPSFASEVAAPADLSRTIGPIRTISDRISSNSQPSQPGPTIAAAIGAAWLLGALLLLARTVRSYARTRAIRRTLTVLPEESFGAVLDDVRRRLNLARLPQIAASDRVWTPCVLGLFRPVIALPADALRKVSSRELGDVLVHEGAHVVRHDCVMALVQKIAGALFWPHPLVHWLNRRLTSVREDVCDNYVLAGSDVVSYGETLLRFAQTVGRHRPLPAAVGMLHGLGQYGSGRLEKRIAGLIDARRNRHTRAGNVSRALALVAFGSLFVLACGGRGHTAEPIAIESQSGQALTPTLSLGERVAEGRVRGSKAPLSQKDTQQAPYSIAQTPPPKPDASAKAADTRGGMKLTNGMDRGRDRGSVRERILAELKHSSQLSKSEIDSVQLVPGKPHTLRVPEAVRIKLGIRRDNVDRLAIARRVVHIPPLILPAHTSLDPSTIFRLRPYPYLVAMSPSGATIVEIGKVATRPHRGLHGETGLEERELRPGDRVHKGDLLIALHSGVVANTESDLLDALSQLKLDKEILKQLQADAKDAVTYITPSNGAVSVPLNSTVITPSVNTVLVNSNSPDGRFTVPLLTAKRNVQADQNAADRAMRTLQSWGIPEKAIQAIRAAAERPKAGGENRVGVPGLEWGRIELRSPIDGTVIERNVALHEAIESDATLFSVANLRRLLVQAQLPDKARAALRALGPQPAWCVDCDRGGSGGAAHEFVTEVGSFTNEIDTQVDPNQQTVSLNGDVDNKQGLLRGGQFVKVRIPLPIEGDVLEVPGDCIQQNSEGDMLVFLQTDPAKDEFTAQRVNLAPIFVNNNDFLWSKPIAGGDGTPSAEADPSRLPLKPVTPGTRLVQNGVDELWQILKEREKRAGGN